MTKSLTYGGWRADGFALHGSMYSKSYGYKGNEKRENIWATCSRTRLEILPLGGDALLHYNLEVVHTMEDLSILYPHQLPLLHFSGWQHLRGLWPSGEFTAKLYTDVMKSNIGCAMSYEMLFSFRILLLQSVMTIFPFIWLLTL